MRFLGTCRCLCVLSDASPNSERLSPRASATRRTVIQPGSTFARSNWLIVLIVTPARIASASIVRPRSARRRRTAAPSAGSVVEVGEGIERTACQADTAQSIFYRDRLDNIGYTC